MFGINYKMWIAENTQKSFQKYLKILNVDDYFWGDISIGYGSVEDVRFNEYFAEGTCNHPKRMYRPGNTVICHFIPISTKVAHNYKEGKISAEEWTEICLNTRRISRGLTDTITATLQSHGREVSLLPERENWSHICGAEITGLGTFNKADDMYSTQGIIGSLGSVITEVKI